MGTVPGIHRTDNRESVRASALLLIAGIAGWSVAGCAPARDPAPVSPPEPAPTLVVLEDVDARELTGVASPPFWRPTQQQLDVLAAEIPAFFRDQFSKHPHVVGARGQRRRPADYVFQVIGAVREGRNVAWINAYCGAPPTAELVVVLDGGPCYFRVVYDFEAGAFSALNVNGVS